MGNLAISKTKLFTLANKNHHLPPTVLTQLQALVEKTYQLPKECDFYRQFIDLGEATEVILFYGECNSLAGFCASCLSTFKLDNKTHAIYRAEIHFDTPYLGNPIAARFGLTHAMKYKLTHPDSLLALVAEVPTPKDYALFGYWLGNFYPQPALKLPDNVEKVLNLIKKQRHLISQDHPQVVHQKVSCPIKPPANKQYPLELNQALLDYYQEVNPNYQQGSRLLSYVPLDLNNICQGLRRVIEHHQLATI